MIDRSAPGRARVLLVLALLAGLVAMHQLVMPADHGSGHGAGPGAAHVATAGMVAQPAPDHGHEMPAGHATMLEHLCLAVLVALAVLLVVAAVTLLLPPSRRPGAARGPTRILAGPAPVPVPRRLAALQVLRL